ncbi:Core-2/I-branching beta-1,6-N-acetylglucosaminyltransferase family protein [Striga asiatica]|uniref:Core-2/I-branching beta-1,6-N-acetylglucosaminyltransferase family protein n=1 Tax=Striga asiatica TaxID=4170 RepID=A0A5A7RC82_STRAF|nr:Core-2/I-branching beta-1,6-N-acetylglucosaminyltransferase family protein [Striga asiatica]
MLFTESSFTTIPGTVPFAAVAKPPSPSFATSAGSAFTELSALIFVFLALGPPPAAPLLFSRREAVKLRMELSYSSSSSSSDSSSESESSPAPRTLMLSRSSLEVSAPSRVSENAGGKGGAWSSGGSLRLWIDDDAEADAEWEGDGDWELRERTGAVRCAECPSIVRVT